MTREQLLSNVWVRMLIFAWMIVFPIVFVALPAFDIFLGKTEFSWTPVWGLVVWILGPAVGAIVLKRMIGERESQS